MKSNQGLPIHITHRKKISDTIPNRIQRVVFTFAILSLKERFFSFRESRLLEDEDDL